MTQKLPIRFSVGAWSLVCGIVEPAETALCGQVRLAVWIAASKRKAKAARSKKVRVTKSGTELMLIGFLDLEHKSLDMGKVVLIREDHSFGDRGLSEHDYLSELMGRIKLYAFSFELDEASRIDLKPSIELQNWRNHNEPIVLTFSAADRAQLKIIPIIYADRRDFPKFQEKEELEARMDPDSDEDILKYADLTTRAFDKRDAHTVGVVGH